MKLGVAIAAWAVFAALGTARYAYRLWDSPTATLNASSMLEVAWLIPVTLGAVLGWGRFVKSEDYDWQSSLVLRGILGCGVAAVGLNYGAAYFDELRWRRNRSISNICANGTTAGSLQARRSALSRAHAKWDSDARMPHSCDALSKELSALEVGGRCPEFLIPGVPCKCHVFNWPQDASRDDCPVPVCYPMVPKGHFSASAHGYPATLQCRQEAVASVTINRSGVPMVAESVLDKKGRNCKLQEMCLVGKECEVVELCD